MGLLVALLLFRQLVTVEDIKFSDILMVPWWVVFTVVVGTVNSLTAIGAQERQCFNELRGNVVSRRVFIRSQSLIAR